MNISADLKKLFKGPWQQKRFWAAKQLYVGRHRIKGRPGLKTGWKQNRGAPFIDSSFFLDSQIKRNIRISPNIGPIKIFLYIKP